MPQTASGRPRRRIAPYSISAAQSLTQSLFHLIQRLCELCAGAAEVQPDEARAAKVHAVIEVDPGMAAMRCSM